MLFNSWQFIAVFLPVTLAVYFALTRHRALRLGWLLLASVVFYTYWDIRFLPLLLGSVLVNWGLSHFLNQRNRNWLIVIGVGFNLALIGIFKYLDFFISIISDGLGRPIEPLGLILPLGISFFTFQQISYLVDRSHDRTPAHPLLDYALYVTFFPQLIAGPIVRHNEIIPQYRKSPLRPDIYHHFASGMLLFTLGLAKKTLIADRLASAATPLFDQAAIGQVLSQAEAWVASCSYSLQLYFDFSGYSDMAIGLGLMMGFGLPENFNAPYRAINIQDFWRRWHMTLSRFLRDYLYIPLGGNRQGKGRLLLALYITMFLGGLWHGAGWTFVIWGLLHATAVVVFRLWRGSGLRMPGYVGWMVTLLFLLFSWVMFRAADAATAWSMWQSMLGVGGTETTFQNPVSGWFMLAAFLLAVLGPTSQKFVIRYFQPRLLYAAALAVALIYLTLNSASDGYSEFLYFQF
jgi:D-alanyl-lipoteichoic acid acyltransferase DltB (MBOAT superfamily)